MSPEMPADRDPPQPSEPADLRVPAPVLTITGVWDFARPPGHRDHRLAPGGHLLHLLVEGRAGIEIDGRSHAAAAGDLVSYHGRCAVRFRAGAGRVRFWSVAFIAPGLAPAPPDRRVLPATGGQRAAFARLVALAGTARSPARSIGLHACLLGILEPWAGRLSEAEEPWQRAELWLRDRRRFRPGLEELAAATGISVAGLRRSCKAVTGLPVRAALARLRLREAEQLLSGGMAVGDAARLLGFRRTQELSRAYARFAGHPPTRGA